jgi:hypothetical protein
MALCRGMSKPSLALITADQRLLLFRSSSHLRPQLPFKHWREHVDSMQTNIERRRLQCDLPAVLELHSKHAGLQQQLETARAERNRLTAAVKVRHLEPFQLNLTNSMTQTSDKTDKNALNALVSESKSIKQLIQEIEVCQRLSVMQHHGSPLSSLYTFSRPPKRVWMSSCTTLPVGYPTHPIQT